MAALIVIHNFACWGYLRWKASGGNFGGSSSPGWRFQAGGGGGGFVALMFLRGSFGNMTDSRLPILVCWCSHCIGLISADAGGQDRSLSLPERMRRGSGSGGSSADELRDVDGIWPEQHAVFGHAVSHFVV
ncbi:hypothetical protein KCP69_15540 [Salmonella enterica subsp. enterica]|nr:hypothetical protein KCP69_15540 [Salmonella enterica subsp. enterica]